MASVRILACAAPCRVASATHGPKRTPRNTVPSSWVRQPRRMRVSNSRRSDMHDADPEPSYQVDAFDVDCAAAVIRVMTAKAVQKVLLHLQEADSFSAQWLNRYTAEHPPLEGNTFIAGLMSAPPKLEVDPYTGFCAEVHPQSLATRIMATREELIRSSITVAHEQVAKDNTNILRKHLESHTYVSGSSDVQKPSYRAYRNSRNQQHYYQL